MTDTPTPAPASSGFKPMVVVDWALDRLSERSTWLGIIALFVSAGIKLDPQQAAMVAAGGAALSGAILVFTKDHNIAEAITTAVKDGFLIKNPNLVVANTVVVVDDKTVHSPHGL